MEQQRNLLFILLLCAAMFLFWDWNADKANAQKMADQAANLQSQEISSESALGNLIKVVSDNLELTINLKGGDIVDAKLLKIKQEQDKEDPFQLLMTTPQFKYQAQSGLAGRDGIDNRERPEFKAEKTEYRIEDGQNNVTADITFEKDGVTYTKSFSIDRNSYVVNVSYLVNNKSEKDLNLCMYGQLKQTADDSYLQNNSGFGMVASAYRGTAYSSDESRYEKKTLSDIIDDKSYNVTTKEGWVAMIQHYFVSAWIGGENNVNNVIYSNHADNNTSAIIGIRTDSVNVAAGNEAKLSSKLWVGPKNQDAMESVAKNLELTVDYGWLWFISIPLFKILTFIHSIIGNWGFSIIVLTMIVRGVMFPLTKAQYTSMAKMRLLQPKLMELRERYKDDRQKIGTETMKLYKSEKVNPLGGCLPLLIQMPIFIALYWTLMESTELRQSSFMLWITDLSVKDPYFVLPILYGVTMFYLQKMSPTPVTDPVQRKVFMAMPFVFTFMFCTFPAGLTLYWLVSNCFTILQQFVIFRSLEKRGLSMKKQPASK
ncbi:protein translocase subunit yidC [Succinivibrio dextrinosolvens DSM 3072]|uniref:Membrane protein insertase YidC n=1 Tax=Succinivibrio dextrinosolvens DSM 3072 TaxID=1123324 RepID=A0A1T4V2X0_9GAMM|nr:membrane protein insertase YidC [Succinivibrio dextrinosolvens]SKA59217.1 protein translocase subunit yidC [Succinivibrio dextrinosolvens DSM 3072]